MVPAQNSGRECRVLAENSPRISFYRNTTALGICMLCAISLSARSAQAGGVLPTNGQYVAGQGSISSAGNQLTVNQASSHGIINWNSFSIGAGNQVQFNNGSGATLNRVTGGNLSQIDGALKATGSVYLINPQGIVIGPGGQVITNGSFVASTRDVSNNGFMSGGAFAASGSSSGSVVNQGVITSNTGDAILVGSTVRNSGVISAPNGTVGLAAGNEITLQPLGSDARIAISGGTGSVTNSGNIRAAQAELNAAGGNVYALVENNGGAISATGTQTINGHVWLLAGGTTSVSGTITARNANGSGGAIETSGHSLVLNHANVNAGRGGQWLVDPDDLDVDATAATIIDSSLNAGTSVTLRTTASGTSGPGTVNANGQGDINIQSAINWNTAATLTLDAYHGINITAPITVQANGKIVLTTNDGGTGGDLSFGLGASGFAGNIAFIGTEGSGQSLTINGAAYTLLYSMSELEGLNTYRVGDYALAKPLDASSVTNWVPIGYGNTTQSQFANLFEGLGNTISNLTVNAGPDGGGLFGVISGTVRDVGVVGGSVRGSSELGGLAGGLFAGKVDDAYSTATVTGTGGSIGGLIGVGGGPIANSYAAGSVTGTAGVGGLVGLFSGSLVLTNSFYDIDRVLINGTHAVTLGGMYDAQYQDWIAHNLTLKPANYFGAPDANGFYSVSSVQGFEDLLGFSESSSPKFKLTHNLDLSSAPSFFIPYFEGTLNGQGYTISNFSLGETSATSNLPFGLFGVLSGGMITNVGLVNASVSGNEFVGGLVGLSNDGAVSNASVTGTVSGTSFYVGGLVGLNYGTISNSAASGTVTGASGYVGGLTGANGGTITGSSSSASVGGVYDVGGLAGDNGGSIGSSFSTSTVTLTDSSPPGINFGIGGLVGTNEGTVTDSYATANISNNSTSSHSSTGGLVGLNSGSVSGSYAEGNVSGFNVVGGLVGLNDGGSILNSYATGSVTSSEGDAGGLVGHNEADIENSYATGSVSAGTAGSGAGGLVGFNDTGGTISTSSASGAVSGLDDLGGLAGYNVGTINGVLATGQVTGKDLVGGLVGENDQGGTISQAGATGNVTATATSGSRAGGLVGLNTGGSAISQSYATGNVSGNIAGGLVGDNQGSITESWAGGAVSGASYYIEYPLPPSGYAGGLVGFNESGASVTYAYAIGNVGGTAPVANTGGLIGVSQGTVNQVYASGALLVSGGGGLVGTVGGGSVSNGYWDNTAISVYPSPTNNTNAFASGSGTNIVPASYLSNAYKQPTYTNFDFGSGGHWYMVDGDTRPFLQSEVWSIGTNQYLVTNTHQLQLIALNLSGQYQLPDLPGFTLNASDSAGAWGTSLGNNLWSTGGFVTLGSSATPFTGDFNGKGGTITDLHIGANANDIALFGVIGTGGTVENLALTALDVSAVYNVGGLAGINQGTVSNVCSSGTIFAGLAYNSDAGGLVGQNQGTISNASSSASVTGQSNVGGIAGSNSGTIEQVSSSASVSGAGGTSASTYGVYSYTIGGLVGSNSGTISDTAATGPVIGFAYVGGLVGSNSGMITQSLATGTVTSFAYAGGLVGANQGGTISEDGATGTVTAYNGSGPSPDGVVSVGWAGGLVAWNESGTISQSYATGSVTGTVAGGLVGDNAATVTESWAGGTVSGGGSDTSGEAGGLIGLNERGSSVTYDYAIGNVGGPASASDIGGLIGNSSGTVNEVYASGALLVSGGGGLVGTVAAGSVSSGYWDNSFTNNGNAFAGGSGTNIASDSYSSGTAYQQSTYAKFDFGSGGHWYMINGQTRPFLQGEVWSTGANQYLVTNSHQLQLVELNLAGDHQIPSAPGFTIDAADTGTGAGSGMWTAAGFVPLGNGTKPFKGTFNGNGSAIAGLTIDTPTSKDVGLFDDIGATATVENLVLAGADIVGGNFTGAVAGDNQGTIENVQVGSSTVTGTNQVGGLVGYNVGNMTGDLSGATVYGASDLGVVAGWNGSAGSITSSFGGGRVTGTGNFVGDIAGENDGTLANDTSEGVVTGVDHVGGFVGWNDGTITGSTATGAAVGTKDVGGFAGTNGAGGSITQSSSGDIPVSGAMQVGGFVGWNSATLSNDQVYYAPVNATNAGAGGFVGYNAPGGTITGSSVTGNTRAGTYTGAVGIDAPLGAGGFAGSNFGTLSNDTATQLDVGDSAAHWVGGFVGWNAGSGTVTGGAVTNTNVVGNYDVGGFVGDNAATISNSSAQLSAIGAGSSAPALSAVAEAGGFAGTNEAGAMITDSSASIGAAGPVTGTNRIGGFAGQNLGTLSGGDTASDAVVGASYVGGLVGWNAGSIADSYATGTVSALTWEAGGLVGYNIAGATISTSYASGNVSAKIEKAGGLVGVNMGTIENSEASGAVGTAGAPLAWGVGGLVGVNGGSVSTSYSTGIAIGGVRGGFLGVNLATGALSNDYWDLTTSLLTTGVALDYSNSNQAGFVHYLTTAQLQAALPAGFDPSIWGLDPGTNGGLPYLLALSGSY